MNRRPKPACAALPIWLRENGFNLGALTGTDAKALAAAIHIIELYAYTGDEGLLHAFGVVVLQMQPTTRRFAYHAIAHVMDWPDRARLWRRAGLPEADVAGERGMERDVADLAGVR